MKRLFTFCILLFLGGFQLINAQLNVTYQGNIEYDEELSDIWGYVAPDNSEYAIVGVYDGVSIVDLSDPENMAFFAAIDLKEDFRG